MSASEPHIIASQTKGALCDIDVCACIQCALAVPALERCPASANSSNLQLGRRNTSEIERTTRSANTYVALTHVVVTRLKVRSSLSISSSALATASVGRRSSHKVQPLWYDRTSSGIGEDKLWTACVSQATPSRRDKPRVHRDRRRRRSNESRLGGRDGRMAGRYSIGFDMYDPAAG